MLFRTLAKAEFREMVGVLLASSEVVGPVRTGPTTSLEASRTPTISRNSAFASVRNNMSRLRG